MFMCLYVCAVCVYIYIERERDGREAVVVEEGRDEAMEDSWFETEGIGFSDEAGRQCDLQSTVRR